MPSPETFNSSTTWTAPTDVTSVDVECWGGGGGGASGGPSSGGGGGGGAYSKKTVSVTPASNYTVTVGAGGDPDAYGGDTWFSTSGTVLAKGGEPNDGEFVFGAGGAAGSGIGDTKYSGGDGSFDGGGGSSAGTGANGTAATSSTGATAPTGGGDGGDNSTFGTGEAGSAPGGGGGGSLFGTGGAGAAGRVVLTYTAGGGGATPKGWYGKPLIGPFGGAI